MKKLLLPVLCLCTIISTAYGQRWQDRQLSDDERIDALISELTLQEKLDLISFGAVRRLGIRPHGGMEAIHGLVIGGPARSKAWPTQVTTSFPQGYGLGETWDADLLHSIGEQMSVEARAIYNSPDSLVRGSLVLWAPNADLGRDPRWGRTEECFGEDPMLVGALSASMIRGMQGPDPRYWRAASLMKHFLANSNECDRVRTSSDVTDKQWREYYSYGFYKGFMAGGSSYMAAYNKLNGVPCTVHPMLRDIVADEWGVSGIVTTDGGAFSQLMTTHHYFDNAADAAAACLLNGVNMYLDRYREGADEALAKGLVTERDIDKCLRGRVRVMLKLGLLDAADDTDNPYLAIGGEPWHTQAAHDLALRAARENVVLLKNDGLLPLDKSKIRRIAVVGNRADTIYADWYGGEPPYRVTPLQAIKAVADREGIEVRHVPYDKAGSASDAARWADVVIACVGNHPVCSTDYDTVPPPWGVGAAKGDGREEVDRQSLQLDTEDMIRVLRKYNDNVVVALISSFPYAINWTADHVGAIVHCAQSGQELGNALADVLFGDYNPGGRLTQTWPRAIDDLPDLMDYDIGHGRTYMYAKAEPLYAFGHGLSYTTFEYDNLSVKREGDNVLVSVDVKNTGARDGDEVVQIYAQLPGDDAQQRLKAFRRVPLLAGESQTVLFEIPLSDLRLWDVNANAWSIPQGRCEIRAAASSADVRCRASIDL